MSARLDVYKPKRRSFGFGGGFSTVYIPDDVEVWIDDEDTDLNGLFWYIHRSGDGYRSVVRYIGQDERGAPKYQRLARPILARKLERPIRKDWHCHHLDGNSVGNQLRSNLLELPSELHSLLFFKKNQAKTSAFRWVSLYRRPGYTRWTLRFPIGQGGHLRKYYDKEEDAARVADALFLTYYGHWFERYPDLPLNLFLNFAKGN